MRKEKDLRLNHEVSTFKSQVEKKNLAKGQRNTATEEKERKNKTTTATTKQRMWELRYQENKVLPKRRKGQFC